MLLRERLKGVAGRKASSTGSRVKTKAQKKFSQIDQCGRRRSPIHTFFEDTMTIEVLASGMELFALFQITTD